LAASRLLWASRLKTVTRNGPYFLWIGSFSSRIQGLYVSAGTGAARLKEYFRFSVTVVRLILSALASVGPYAVRQVAESSLASSIGSDTCTVNSK
jgi:hypothetical protein